MPYKYIKNDLKRLSEAYIRSNIIVQNKKTPIITIEVIQFRRVDLNENLYKDLQYWEMI